MAITASYIPDPSQTDPQAVARAAALGIGIAPRAVPPVYATAVTKTPGVVAEYGVVVFLHDDGTLTPSAVTALVAPLNAQQTADQDAGAAAIVAAANAATIQQKAAADLTTIEAWITANPAGALLTGPQTLVLAKMLAGVGRLVLNQTNVTGPI